MPPFPSSWRNGTKWNFPFLHEDGKGPDGPSHPHGEMERNGSFHFSMRMGGAPMAPFPSSWRNGTKWNAPFLHEDGKGPYGPSHPHGKMERNETFHFSMRRGGGPMAPPILMEK